MLNYLFMLVVCWTLLVISFRLKRIEKMLDIERQFRELEEENE